jgi:hypothetical protein
VIRLLCDEVIRLHCDEVIRLHCDEVIRLHCDEVIRGAVRAICGCFIANESTFWGSTLAACSTKRRSVSAVKLQGLAQQRHDEALVLRADDLDVRALQLRGKAS